MIRILCSPNSQSLIKLYQEVIVYKNIHTIFYAAFFSIFSTSILAAPTYDVFSEGFGTDWSSQPWGATVTVVKPTSLATVFKGTTSAQVEFTSSMGVFKAVAKGGFNTLGYKHLIFAVYNYSKANNLWAVAQRADGTLGKYLKVADYADKWDLPQGKWSYVRIPIDHFGLGSNPILSFFSVASGAANSIAYFDEVRFAASSVLYEGAKDFSYGPGIQLWWWNGDISKSIRNSDPIIGENYSIRLTTTSSWGGVQFQHRVGNLKTSDYGAVSIRIKTADIYKLNQFRVYLADNNGKEMGVEVPLDYRKLPATIDNTKQNQYYHFTIKMSEFGISSASIGGIIIRIVEPSTIQVDDIRFIQKLSWVMDVTRTPTSWYGDYWNNSSCGVYKMLHTGTDYTDYADSGVNVYAASRGIVRDLPYQPGWGQAVIIQHENGFTTSYLHLDEDTISVTNGTEVQRGTLLGKTKYLTTGSHLHFGARVADFHIDISQKGALPKASCDEKPAFSERFIDSEKFDWGPKL